jgi:putative ABC transport system ATP-binding protein
VKHGGFSLILRSLRSRWRNVTGGCLFMMGHQTGESLVPVAIGFFIDSAVRSGDYSDLIPGMLAVAAVFIGLSNSWRFGAKLLLRAAKGVEHDLRIAVVRKVLEPAGGPVTRRLPGEVLNIATIDAERVGRLANVAATACGAFAALAVTTIVLLRISIPLGLLVLIGSVPLIALIQFLGRTLEKHSGVEQAQAARAAGLCNDLVSGLRVLKGIGAEGAAVDRYRDASRASLEATKRAARTQATYQGLNMALTGAFLALVAYVGGRLAADGDISTGDLIAALGLTQFLIGPMQRLTNVGALFARGRASATRIHDLLTSESAYAAGKASLPEGIRGELRLLDVVHDSLRGLAFEVQAGELVGVAARDQQDAVALLDCLSGDAFPEAGAVLLDGIDTREVRPEELHRAVLVVPHDSYLFAESLLDNVRASAVNGVADAIAASATDEVASNLPQGIDTVLSEGGSSLSGGQRQRVALARALAARAPVLVLHDPTTAVDSVTEARIAAGIRDSRHGLTTLLVTTSPALLAVTSRVVLIEDGRVTADDGHTQLVDAREDYRELVLS